jgi:hypothetical protein
MVAGKERTERLITADGTVVVVAGCAVDNTAKHLIGWRHNWSVDATACSTAKLAGPFV